MTIFRILRRVVVKMHARGQASKKEQSRKSAEKVIIGIARKMKWHGNEMMSVMVIKDRAPR